MSKTQRTLTLGLWGLTVLSLLGLIAMMRLEAARAGDDRAQPDLVAISVDDDGRISLPAPSFKLTDQQGQPFDAASLKGKLWTASFFFSKCEGVCPGMMMRIKDLQRAIPDPNVHHVYFTVDPERDTPERLAEYGKEAGADPTRWHMLTGEVAEMKRIAAAFGKPFETPAGHSAAILLVDRDGKVVGAYESKHPEQMTDLADHIRTLLADAPASAEVNP